METDEIALLSLIKTINLPHFKLCLDIGHAHIRSIKPLEDWIAACGGEIAYAHLHNKDGIRDLHQGLNNGTMEVIKVLTALKQHTPEAIWSMENSEPEASLLLLEENACLFK